MPETARLTDRCDRSELTSRKAAIGATRPARSAGANADTSVTRAPTTTDVTMVDAAITIGPLGMLTPTWAISARSANDIPTPATRPVATAAAATASASMSTDRMTCARLAPIARSRARSRVRWATTIENVL